MKQVSNGYVSNVYYTLFFVRRFLAVTSSSGTFGEVLLHRPQSSSQGAAPAPMVGTGAA